jgi:hypothetical protein
MSEKHNDDKGFEEESKHLTTSVSIENISKVCETK